MQGTMIYGPRDIRFEDRPEPRITNPTDAVIRISAACVCGSDLWPYRGIQPIAQPTLMGHEYCGIVEEVGSTVKSVKRGQFVIGSFFASDNVCPRLPDRLSVVLPAPRTRRRRTGSFPARPTRGRYAGRHA